MTHGILEMGSQGTGTRTGTLTITDNAAHSPQTITLGGTGQNSMSSRLRAGYSLPVAVSELTIWGVVRLDLQYAVDGG